MSYELTEILSRCTTNDIQFLISTIDSYFNFTDDKGLKEEFQAWKRGTLPESLAKKLETEIRYLGSSDVAYAARKLRGVEPAGVPVQEMIDDVAKFLKVKAKKVGTLERRLEALAKTIVEKTFFSLEPKEQIEFLKSVGFEDKLLEKLKEEIKDKAMFLPALLYVVGEKVALEVVQKILMAVLANILGKQAAKELLAVLVARMPWLAGLGPVVTVVAVAWTAIDLCGPAMRKTAPILLHLSVVSLRNGVEDKNFWTEDD